MLKYAKGAVPWYTQAARKIKALGAEEFDLYVVCEYGATSQGTCSQTLPYYIKKAKSWMRENRHGLLHFNLLLTVAMKAVAGLTVSLPFVNEATPDQVESVRIVAKSLQSFQDLTKFLDGKLAVELSGTTAEQLRSACLAGHQKLSELLEECTTWHEVIFAEHEAMLNCPRTRQAFAWRSIL